MKKLPRMTSWLLVTLVLTAIIAILKPELLPVSLYKLSLITMAGVVAFGLDVSIFPYARPDSFLNALDWRKEIKKQCAADYTVADGYELVFALAMLRRAIIVGSAMLATSLGA